MTVRPPERMEDKHPEDAGCAEATEFLGHQSRCSKCPFPVCTKHEGEKHKQLNKRHRDILVLSGRGLSPGVVSKRVKVHERTVYRVLEGRRDCEWCTILDAASNPYCRSSECTIVRKESGPVAILARHGVADQHEARIMQTFVEYLFPDGVIEKANSEHEHWFIKGVK